MVIPQVDEVSGSSPDKAIVVLIAQLDRASKNSFSSFTLWVAVVRIIDCKSEGCGFESHSAPLWVEGVKVILHRTVQQDQG